MPVLTPVHVSTVICMHASSDTSADTKTHASAEIPVHARADPVNLPVLKFIYILLLIYMYTSVEIFIPHKNFETNYLMLCSTLVFDLVTILMKDVV